jgi:hypothetical protein
MKYPYHDPHCTRVKTRNVDFQETLLKEKLSTQCRQCAEPILKYGG